MRADIVKIGSELQNKYDDHLMSGGFNNLKYTTYYPQFLKGLGSTFSINLSRRLTYLNRVSVSFMEDTTTNAGKSANPIDFWMKPRTCVYHTTRF